MEGSTLKAFIISALLALLILSSSAALTSLSKKTSAVSHERNRYKNLLLLDFALKDGQPSGQAEIPGLLRFLIKADTEKGSLLGQSTFQPTPATYTLSVKATLKNAPASGKKYVVWAAQPAGTGTYAIPVGEGTGTVITVDSFKATSDVTTYVIIVTQEDASEQASLPSATHEVEASQQRNTGRTDSPTSAPNPTSAPTGPTAVPGVPTAVPGAPTAPAAPTTPPPGSPTQGPISGEELNAQIQKAIQAVKQSNIETYLGNLVDNDATQEKDENQNRVTRSSGNIKEAEYIKSIFDAYGIESHYQDFTQDGTTSRNILGRIHGTDRNTWYIVMAHMDSIVHNTPGWKSTDPAPGADDNGSGTAAVLEIARALKESGAKLDSSILFILFSAEEQGRYGSKYYAANVPLTGVNGIINLDMIGNRGSTDNCVNAQYKPRTGGNLIADEFVAINNQFNIGLTTRSSDEYIEWSDHHWFIERGIMGSFVHECTMSPNWHKLTDTTDALSYSQITKVAQGVAGALVKVSHTKLGKGFSGLDDEENSVLGSSVPSAQASILVRAYYTEEQGPKELYSLADIPINYYEGGDITKPFFLGLFNDASLAKTHMLGYTTETLDEQADMSLYTLLWYPTDGGAELIAQAQNEGLFERSIELTSHLFLIKYDKPHEFEHEGSLAGFFDVHLPTNSKAPKFDTPRITPAPVVLPDALQQKPARNWNTLIFILFGLGAVVLAGIAAYLHKASRT